jgi:hypothetical protein
VTAAASLVTPAQKVFFASSATAFRMLDDENGSHWKTGFPPEIYAAHPEWSVPSSSFCTAHIRARTHAHMHTHRLLFGVAVKTCPPKGTHNNRFVESSDGSATELDMFPLVHPLLLALQVFQRGKVQEQPKGWRRRMCSARRAGLQPVLEFSIPGSIPDQTGPNVFACRPHHQYVYGFKHGRGCKMRDCS